MVLRSNLPEFLKTSPMYSEYFCLFQILLNSKLHVDVLGRVWDLSDIDKDGMLDKDEFAVVSKFG